MQAKSQEPEVLEEPPLTPPSLVSDWLDRKEESLGIKSKGIEEANRSKEQFFTKGNTENKREKKRIYECICFLLLKKDNTMDNLKEWETREEKRDHECKDSL